MTQPLAAYTRVSTAGQAESGLGIAAQRDAILTAGIEVGGWFEDAGISGAKMANRPGLQAALEGIRSGRFGGLVVSKLDRLGRNAAEILSLAETAKKEGWRLLMLDVGEVGGIAGEAVLMALSLAARIEWIRCSERQTAKFAVLRREGRPRGRTAARPEVADRIIAMREAGSTWQRIADFLNGGNVPCARAGREWRPSSVRSAARTRQRELEAQAAADLLN